MDGDVMTVCGGIGIGVVFGGLPRWTPKALGAKLYAYYEPTLGLTAASVTWADGNMETAGTGSWTATAATLSKATTTPHNGLQCLRVTSTGAGKATAHQAVGAVGERVIVAGWYRCDGVCAPCVDVGTTSTAIGTATSWTYFSVEATFAANGNVYLGMTPGVGAGEWVEFDDVTVTARSINAWADQSGNGHHFAVAVAAAKPYIGSRSIYSVVDFDGAADTMQSTEAAAVWALLHSGAGMTYVKAFWFDDAGGANQTLIDTGAAGGLPNRGFTLYVVKATKTLIVNITSGAATVFVGSYASAVVAGANVVSVSFDDAETPQVVIRCNGTTLYSGARTGAPSAADPTWTAYIGAYVGAALVFDGGFGKWCIANDRLTASELTNTERWAGASIGKVL